MSKIKSKNLKKVISKFDSILPLSDSERMVDMSETRVFSECGSPMCHAGWYAVACKLQEKSESQLDFHDGAYEMALDLGFSCPDGLEDWASNNEDYWGNDYGCGIFCWSDAFNFTGSLTLRKIRNHWAEVHNRMHPKKEPVKII